MSAEIKSKSLPDMVAEKIKQMIVTGELELGQQVIENNLAEAFSLSKTPIREALLRLTAEGLLVSKPHRGAFVFTFDKQGIHDICYTRMVLEQAALRLAMKRRPEMLVDALDRAVAEAEQSFKNTAGMAEMSSLPVDSTGYAGRVFTKYDYLTHDHDLHKTILDYSDNAYLLAAHQTLAIKVQAMRYRLSLLPAYVGNSLNEHRSVVDSLKKDNIDAACQILGAHINAAFTDLLPLGILESKSTGHA